MSSRTFVKKPFSIRFWPLKMLFDSFWFFYTLNSKNLEESKRICKEQKRIFKGFFTKSTWLDSLAEMRFFEQFLEILTRFFRPFRSGRSSSFSFLLFFLSCRGYGHFYQSKGCALIMHCLLSFAKKMHELLENRSQKWRINCSSLNE